MTGVPEEKENKNGLEAIFEETLVNNLPKPLKDIKPQIQEDLQTPSKINAKEHISRHIRVKLLKTKVTKTILNETEEIQHITSKGQQ